jgi:DNA gyrase/topoisomerase IV subunit A
LGVKFTHELGAAEVRLEVVSGLIKAIDMIDKVIISIRKATSKTEALATLISAPFKFSRRQADAILEMRLHQLTCLDVAGLNNEKTGLEGTIIDLKKLISDDNARTKYMLSEIKSIGVRHGDANRSALVEAPESLAIEKGSTRTAPVAKPRFLKIDMKRGVIEQAKGPRGALLLERTDKLVVLTEDGTLKKVASNFKGPIADNFYPVCLAKKESEVATRSYLLVFSLENQLKAIAIDGADLCKVTSKGKQALPEGAKLLYFGEGPYSVPWISTRKKKVELFPVNTKKGKPGARGIKIAHLDDITL